MAREIVTGIKYAIRTLRREPLFAISSTASLALAVAASTAIFSIVNAVWLRPLPIKNPEHVAILYFRPAATNSDGELVPSAPWRIGKQVGSATGVDAVAFQLHPNTPLMDWVRPRIVTESGLEIAAVAVSHNYFDVLGIPLIGRAFRPDEDVADTASIVINEDFARRQFGSAVGALGGSLATTRGPLTIVGVVSGDFDGARLDERAEVWLTFGGARRFSGFPADLFDILPVAPIVRVRAGEDWRAVGENIRRSTGARVQAQPLTSAPFVIGSTGALERQDQLLGVLWFATLIVLLAGCANLAATLYARAEKRRHEFAVRLSQGASRRSIRALVTGEIATIGLLGLVVALLLARVMLNALSAYSLPAGLELSRLDLSVDWRVFGFAAGSTAIALWLAGFAPVRQILRAQVSEVLARSRGSGDRASVRTRQCLLALHVALSLMLVTAAIALVAKVGVLRYADQGAAVDGTLFLSVRPAFTEAVSDEGARRQERDYRLLLERLRGLPGIAAVSYGDPPLPRRAGTVAIRLPEQAGETATPAVVVRGGPAYATSIGARLAQGRDLESVDMVSLDASSPGDPAAPAPPGGALIETSFAERLWPGGKAVGRLLTVGARQYRVVGVVDDILPSLPRRLNIGTLIVGRTASARVGQTLPEIIVRTDQSAEQAMPAAVSLARAGFEPTPAVKAESFDHILNRALNNEHIGTLIFAWFGTAALVLGLAGIYGLVAFVAARSRRTLAIRAALGASPGRLVASVMMSALVPVGVGAAVGMLLAYAGSRAIDASIVGLETIGAGECAMAASAFLIAAVTASFLGSSGWRHSRIPDILRAE